LAFASPEDGFVALAAAIAAHDEARLLRILGTAGRELMLSGDRVADRAARDAFTAEYQQRQSIERIPPNRAMLLLGSNAWPLPVPMVEREGAWRFDARAGAVLARRRLRFGPLVLEETTIPHATPAAVAAALAEAVAARGLRDLPWTAAARQVQARIGWLRQVEGEAWPDLADTALGATVQDWLAPHLHGLSKLAELAGLGLTEILLHRLDWPQRQRLDTALPARLPLPAGRSAAIDYAREVPTLEARAQHLYGLAGLPPLAEGRVKLQVALLSPAGRPIAVTGDLAGFWRGGWQDARKDMRGRYPKHNWPEDPARAEPDPPRR
jgi:ATP-dependent helicase HrpB